MGSASRIGGRGRRAPAGFRKQLCNPVRADRRPILGPACKASRCLHRGTPTTYAASVRDTRHRQLPRRAWGTQSTTEVSWGAPPRSPPCNWPPVSQIPCWESQCIPAPSGGQGLGHGRQASVLPSAPGSQAFPGLAGGLAVSRPPLERSGGSCTRWCGSMCGTQGVNRSPLSRSRPPLSGPFLSLLSGHFGFSSPMPLRGRVGPLGKSVFMATRSLSE